MQALIFLKKRMIINWIRSLKERPRKLIGFLFFVVLIFAQILSVRSVSDPAGSGSDKSGITVMLVSFILVAFFTMIECYNGLARGSAMFSKADTHFLFTSPFRPQTVLMYGMVTQATTTIFSSLFIIYQYPSLLKAGFSTGGVFSLFGIWVLFMILAKFIGMLFYTLAQLRPLLRRLLLYLSALPWAGLAGYALILGLRQQPFYRGLMDFAMDPAVRLVPVGGWALELVYGVRFGMTGYAWVCLALLILVPPLIAALLYRLPCDYYEDALVTAVPASTTADLNEAKHEMQNSRYKTIKVRGTGLGGHGASAVFFRHWREARRVSPQIINGFSLFFALCFLVIVLWKGPSAGNPQYIFFGTLIFCCVISLFTASAGRFAQDLNRPAFYLLPIEPRRLVVSAALVSTITNFVNFLPFLLIAGLFSKLQAPVLILYLLIFYGLYWIFAGAQLLTFFFLGSVTGFLETTLLYMLEALALIPVLGFTAAATVYLMQQNLSLFYLFAGIALLLELVLSALALIPVPSYFRKGPDNSEL